MKNLLLIPLCLMGYTGFSQNVEWAKNFGGSATSLYNGDRGQGIAVDNNGNVYSTGYYQHSASFGTSTLTNPAQEAVFVAKQDGSGNVIWATGFNSSSTLAASKGTRIITDNLGNVYTTGKFYGNVEFGGLTITPLGEFDPNSRADIFVAKQNSSGDVLWLKKMGGSGVYEEGSDITVDNSGNVYICGHYDHSEYANYPAEFGNIPLPSTGSQQNIFVTKLDNSGETIWAKAYGSQNYSYETAKGIAIDDDGNLYVTGHFSDTMVLDGITLTAQNTSSPQTYVVKFNNSGVAQWAVTFTGDSRGIDIAYFNDKVYIIGDYENNITIGTTTLTSSGPSDIFITNLNAQTGSVGWAKKIGSNQVYDNGYGIAVSSDNDIYITGAFNGTLSLESTNISSSGSSDAFIIKLNNSGTPVWGKALGGNESDIGTAVAANNGFVYVAGYFFSSSAQFGNINLTSFGGNDIFVAKITDNNTMNVDETLFSQTNFRLYPNPANSILHVEVKENTNIKIVNFLGATVATQQLQTGNNAVDVSSLTKGIYFVHNSTGGAVKFIKD